MFTMEAVFNGACLRAAYAARPPTPACRRIDATTASHVSDASAERSASTSATRSSIHLPGLSDHPELLHPRTIHDVQHRDDSSVRHAPVRFQRGPLDPPGAKHRSERPFEIVP